MCMQRKGYNFWLSPIYILFVFFFNINYSFAELFCKGYPSTSKVTLGAINLFVNILVTQSKFMNYKIGF